MPVWKGITKTLVRLISKQKKTKELKSAPNTLTIYQQLMNAKLEDKRDIVINLIDTVPRKPLELPAGDNAIADLSGADLSGLVISTIERKADLRGANLEGANLCETEIKFAKLEDARLVKTQMQKVHLENSCLKGTSLTEADFESAHLAYTCFQKAQATCANFSRADLTASHLENATLAYSNLQDAYLLRAKLQNADLHGSDLRGGNFLHADLTQVNLQDTKLQQVDLSKTKLKNIFISGAQLEWTRLQRDQLGGKIGEEVEGQYKQANEGYRILKQNFEQLGDYGAASWAFVKEKQMEKKASAPWRARRFYGQNELGDVVGGNIDGTIERQGISRWHPRALLFYARYFGKWFRNWFIELLCGYGERWEYVVAWMFLLLVFIGPQLFSNNGVFYVTGDAAKRYWEFTTDRDREWYLYWQRVLYMLDVFTTANFSNIRAVSDISQLLSGCLAMTGIFLTGLLGFVFGNWIRRS